MERELGRLQAEIDSLQGRLDRLKSEVAFARVAVRVEQKTVLGPLGWLLAGAGSLIGKLFVLK